ncbi:hypothetical protein [Aliiglaciecola sp. LCG003]|uniref:hypothetical protein n=1 Tax=Aliiglaciecola sp. LCG003 TaxID=3053655 RepID=UPI00257426CE|nr:hypothetical protein [Aliiglaciecola sp. LCG003]WJG09889.1 hypothetical protein QR722_02310 [Aliiglaciecola sp. LCG003]
MKLAIPHLVSALILMFAAVFISSAKAEKEIIAQAQDFGCLTDMTPVRGFFVDNLLGDVEATVAVANSENGGEYPVGSVVQLIPTEVMVKREAGFNKVTKDWEFLELEVNQQGSKIKVRGAFEVVNQFGGNCFACHIKAEAKWDMLCEQNHGCDPIILPNGITVSQDMIKAMQKQDPRCNVPQVVTKRTFE